jgi:hypothetical protein
MAISNQPNITTGIMPIGSAGTITAVNNAYTIFDTALNAFDYKIQGQGVYAEHVVSDYSILNIDEPELERMARDKLTSMIIDEIVKKKMVEFTKVKNVDGSIHYRARMFVTPNDQVRILRLAKEIK